MRYQLLMAAAVACAALGITGACDSSTYLPAGHSEVECMMVPRCDANTSVPFEIGFYSNGTTAIPNTRGQACADAQFLRLQFDLEGDRLLKNTYQGCNTAMYNQEVVEAFVSPSAADTTYYHEIELSPSSYLYVAHVHNPYMNGSDLGHTMVDCQSSGIEASVNKFAAQQKWTASLSLPWTLLADNAPPLAEDAPRTASGLPLVWRTNFFRVVMERDVDICMDDGSCLYQAWSAPDTQPAAFHIPPRFGVMVLDSTL